MPIYEYKCQDCGEILDIFHDMNTQVNRCGFRCQLPPETQAEIRGMGLLSRCISHFSSREGAQMRDKPTAQDVGQKGFAVYKNEGEGTIRKIAGRGPDVIHTSKPK